MSRYPKFNLRVINTILSIIKNNPSSINNVLDYGCGNGRYIPAIIDNSSANVIGYDISQVALIQAQRYERSYPHRVSLFHKYEDVHRFLREEGETEMCLMLFGVLSHIKGRYHRRAVLSWVNRHLNENGKLIISVPNKRRRFLLKQLFSSTASSDIHYKRKHKKHCFSLFYHLYSVGELREDLEESGFVVEHLTAESFLPEKWATKNPLFQHIDNAICKLIPACFGYGILAVARRKE